jgi:hypothetical protein|nr:MAG TPA: hypothetical protein [Caudoviricetes sp.]
MKTAKTIASKIKNKIIFKQISFLFFNKLELLISLSDSNYYPPSEYLISLNSIEVSCKDFPMELEVFSLDTILENL